MHQDRPSSAPNATGEEVLCVLLGVKLCLLHRCSGKLCQVRQSEPCHTLASASTLACLTLTWQESPGGNVQRSR